MLLLFVLFGFAMCLAIVIAAFQRRAFLAFPPIKHEKQQKQHAVFLMHVTCVIARLNGCISASTMLPCGGQT